MQIREKHEAERPVFCQEINSKLNMTVDYERKKKSWNHNVEKKPQLFMFCECFIQEKIKMIF